MSEVNERWQRDQNRFAKLTGYLAMIAGPAWAISYATSGPIYTMPQWQWFAAVSTVTMVAAIVCSIGTAIIGGIMLTNEKPLPGSNR